jgi:hypothetical protein
MASEPAINREVVRKGYRKYKKIGRSQSADASQPVPAEGREAHFSSFSQCCLRPRGAGTLDVQMANSSKDRTLSKR